MLQKTEFRVTDLNACVPEGVPVVWQGRELTSGPLTIELEDNLGNRGVLDYEQGRARAEFHVRLAFPELAATLAELGVDASLTAPVRAVLRSEGAILEDHSFALSGRCDLAPHAMLTDGGTEAAVLPGH